MNDLVTWYCYFKKSKKLFIFSSLSQSNNLITLYFIRHCSNTFGYVTHMVPFMSNYRFTCNAPPCHMVLVPFHPSSQPQACMPENIKCSSNHWPKHWPKHLFGIPLQPSGTLVKADRRIHKRIRSKGFIFLLRMRKTSEQR